MTWSSHSWLAWSYRVWGGVRGKQILCCVLHERITNYEEHVCCESLEGSSSLFDLDIAMLSLKVIIFWLENEKFEFSRKQYIFLKHSKREFCAEFYYHF